jgi:hypothetical protein
MEPLPFESDTQRLAQTQEMLLSYDFIQGFRPKTLGQGGCRRIGKRQGQ